MADGKITVKQTPGKEKVNVSEKKNGPLKPVPETLDTSQGQVSAYQESANVEMLAI
ncbi:hypothetical protein DPMN_078886 [Dreissena polymorpha]|uniref:Uncharacterized protein n=1 Tax=Dreissena polymorpha TaxID=45954 RepID=A0A9D3YS30_DREPO|nr:hypothetical protein DPMN_078886 [Dreissena polymorpha]